MITFDFNNHPITREQKGKSIIDLPNEFAVIDLETTGLDPEYCSIIEVAAIKVKDGSVVDSFTSLVRPKWCSYITDEFPDEPFIVKDGVRIQYVDSFITELTGITNEMLDAAPETEQVLESFTDFVESSTIIGHNVNFDINFLYDNCLQYLKKPFANDFIDTMRMSRRLFKDFENHKLATLIKNFGITEENTHRALADCEAILACYLYMEAYIIGHQISLDELRKTRHGVGFKAKDITSDKTSFDESHPIFGKNCVFTGALEKMLRKDAMQLVVDHGGTCGDSVTKKTNYLILGNLDFCKSIKDGKSTKQKKAEKLILKGADLEIISENVFYDLISED